MWDFSFGRALAMVLQTLPFIVLRIVVYIGIALGYVLTVGIGGALGWGFGHMGSGPGAPAGGAFWGGLLGFALLSGALYFAREYILYLMKAAHIAVLVEVYDGKPIPGGQGQIAYGATFVKTHFTESSVLFGVDQLIKGVLRSLFGSVNFFTSFLPIPALQQLIRLAESFVRMSLTYVDEIILAYLIRTQTKNPWSTARDGLILFAQNYMHFLKNAAWLSVLMWGLTVLLFLVFLAPVGALVALFHSGASFWAFGLALVFAVALKKAVMEPIAIAALMQVYFKEIEGQTPNPEWTAKLEQVSSKFRDLAQKAAGWVPGPATPPPTTAPAKPA
ncbi:MAG TPA: hypothetical protein VNU97_16730 [Rhizomicrobium sp.]|jgi:hypothetical protein|nr:hypothetical protein [Rhizomicrobium sp.]